MATAACPAPAPFKPKHGDPETTLRRFEIWYEGIKTYLMFNTRLNAQGQPVQYTENEKLQLALMVGGEDIRDILVYTGNQTITGPESQFTTVFDETLKTLKGAINETAAVHALLGLQQDNEPMTQYYQRVLKAARKIDWSTYTAEKAARDVIIRGCDSDKLRVKALQENPTLEDLVNTAISMENAQAKAKVIANTAVEPVRRIPQDSKTMQKPKKCPNCTFFHRRNQLTCPAAGKQCNECKQIGHFKMSQLCTKQETVKYLSSEEEDELTTNVKQGKHNTVRCVQSAKPGEKQSDQTGLVLNNLPSGSEESDSGTITVDRIEDVIKTVSLTNNPLCNIYVNKVPLEFFADTGARKTIINAQDWAKIEHTTTPCKTTKTFRAYGSQTLLPIIARAKVTISAMQGAKHDTYVYIMNDNSVESLLGREDATALGIVNITPQGSKPQQVQRLHLTNKTITKEEQPITTDIANLLEQHKDMFSGLGKCQLQKVKIPLKPEATARIQPPRPVPFHYQDQLKKYLTELQDNDVIEGPLQGTLEEGTYVSNIVITAKKWSKEEIRVNLDLRHVNDDIVQSYHPIPTPEDLRHEFRNSDTFSSLDANHMFFQWELEENCRKIFTFRTPWGLYRYKRLPSGVNLASAECNNNLRTILLGLTGIVQIQDDIVVHGNEEEHSNRLAAVLERLHSSGFTLRKEKCHWAQKQITWFGKIYSGEGVSIDPDKAQAIKSMHRPTNMEETRSFLQMVQFNIEFLHPGQLEDTKYKNYSQLTYPLRNNKQKGKFVWTPECEEAFVTIQKLMCSDKVLVHYDPTKPTKIYVDFSPYGVSATLAQPHLLEHTTGKDHHKNPHLTTIDNKIHVWKPVTHVSRGLSEAEKNYAQIEGESLAVLFGVTRLRRYVLGTTFLVAGDHKPLLPMYNEGKVGPMRVERHKLKLQGYQFEYIWEPGYTNPADYHSRHPGLKTGTQEDNDEDLCIFYLEDNMPDALNVTEIRRETAQDETLSELINTLGGKQPNWKNPRMKPFKHIYQELSTHNGILYRGERILLPASLYTTAVALSHEGHIGPKQTLNHLRNRVWFPYMTSKVEQFVETCVPCQAANPHNTQEVQGVPAEIRTPWDTVHLDYKGPIGNKYYVHVAIDEFSRFVDVDITTSTSGEKLLPILDKLWASQGTCNTLVTDNGPPYNSQEFAAYCRKMGIKHKPVTPLHPQANGIAENFMKKIVHVTHTAIVEHKDPRREVFKMVMMHNTTGHDTTKIPPAEAMMNRSVKAYIPTKPAALNQTSKDIIQKTKERQLKNKIYHDQKLHAKQKETQIGDQVLLKQQKTTIKPPWDPEPYTVTEVNGREVQLARRDQRKKRDVNDIKILKQKVPAREFSKNTCLQEEDLDIDMTAWRKMTILPRVLPNILPEHIQIEHELVPEPVPEIQPEIVPALHNVIAQEEGLPLWRRSRKPPVRYPEKEIFRTQLDIPETERPISRLSDISRVESDVPTPDASQIQTPDISPIKSPSPKPSNSVRMFVRKLGGRWKLDRKESARRHSFNGFEIKPLTKNFLQSSPLYW